MIGNQKERIKKLKELRARLDREERQKINKTDPEAVFMKTSHGIKTAYNAQASTDEANQVIVAAEVTNEASDVEQLLPMVDQTEKNTSGSIDKVSADSGYSSGENLKELESRSIDAYIPDRQYQSQARGKDIGPFDKANFVYDDNRDLFICPEGMELHFSHYQKRKGKEPLRIYRCMDCCDCSFFGRCTKNKKGRTISVHPYDKELKAMRGKLDSQTGKTTYAKRKQIVEPVFGQIKDCMGFTSFMLRGLFKVNGEFKLVAIAHNLRKIARFIQAEGSNYLNIQNKMKVRLAHS